MLVKTLRISAPVRAAKELRLFQNLLRNLQTATTNFYSFFPTLYN